MRALTFLARRFVAGDSAAEAVAAVKRLEAKGLKAALDFLGEDTVSESQAAAAADEYVALIEKISAAGFKDCNVSIKPTQFGLRIGHQVARRNLVRVLAAGRKCGSFVRLDMEGSPYTQATLDVLFDVFSEYRNVGAVIQSCLKRSGADIAALNKAGARVRLCKGAYKESSEIAFTDKKKVNRNYDELAAALMEHGNYPGLATHDDARIDVALRFAADKGIGRDRFEFQMLYGLRAALAEDLAARGYNVRIYVPYGTHWLPYFVRRIRERKENWMFVLKNLVRE